MVVGEGLCYPPLDLMYMGAILEQNGHSVRIIDGEALDLTPEAVLEEVKAPFPTLIGLATSSTTLELDLALVDRLKGQAKDAIVFITGSQGSKVPDLALEQSTVDAVIRGEPEITALEMAQAIEKGGDPLAVNGLSIRRNGVFEHNEDRPMLEGDALDALPFPSRHLTATELYGIPTMDGPMQTVQSSRGCPINCTYCGYVVAQGIPWRGRSAQNVFDELVEIVNTHGVHNVVFRDPLFACRKDRVKELCSMIEEANLDVKWQCETAIKTLDEDTIAAMSRGGCVSISFGIESGNEEMQQKYSRGKIKSHEHAKDVVDACKRYGIATRGFFMIGFPEETPVMAEETIRLAVYLNADTVQFTAVTPYPDTKLYNDSKGDSEFDFSRFTGTTPVGVAQAMTGEQVSKAIRRGYRRFYIRPSRVLRELRRPQLLFQRIRRYVGLVGEASSEV